MMRPACFGYSLLLGATLAAAQRPAQPATTTTQRFVQPAAAAGCPVSMHALQGSGQGLVAVRDQRAEAPVAPVKGPAARIHLVLGSPGGQTITSATVVVRGSVPRNHLERAAAADPAGTEVAGTEVVRSVDLVFHAEDAKTVAADLHLPGVAVIHSIELRSLGYGDGSSWKVADNQLCRVAPDPLMLVSSAR